MSDDATLDEFTETNSGGGAAKKEVTKPTSWGKIPPDWDENTISEITQLVTDGSHNPPKRVEDGIQILSGRNIQNGYIDFNKEPSYISQSDFEQMDNNHSLRQGDLLMTIVGSIGRSAIVNKKTDFALQRSIALLRTNERVTTPFLKYITDSGRFYKQADSRSRATAQGGLYLEALNKINLPVPSPSEQRKIATVLHTVDQAIQKTEEIIAQSQKVKKGVMQNVLTEGAYEHPEYDTYRLGPIDLTKPNEWELKPFEEFSYKVQDGPHITPDYVDDGISFVSSQNVNPFRDEFDYSQYEKYISKETYKKINQNCRPAKGDLVISRRATIGPTQLIRHNKQFGFFVGVAIIKTNDTVHNPFLEQLMNWSVMEKLWHLKSPGSTMKTLNLGTIKEQKIPLPSLQEQKAIAEILQAQDSSIAYNEQYKKSLQRLKRGLMQDLLSGEVRTTDADIDIPEEIAKYG